MELAPLLITVYDRVDHLRQCVDSLKRNALSHATVLYIASDAAYLPAHESRIAAVRNYIRSIQGFREVIPLNRERNLGSFLSIHTAIEFVLGRHGRLVFLEDDNIVSCNFLEFINDGLRFYGDDSSVFAVCAYNYPVVMPESYKLDIYKWSGFSAWGAGLWLDRWNTIDFDYARYCAIARDPTVRKVLARVMPKLPSYILSWIENDVTVADAIITCQLIRTGKYCIFPFISKVRNLGHDGSGEHCGATDRYLTQALDAGGPCQFIRPLEPDERVFSVLKKHFTASPRERIKMALSQSIPLPLKHLVKKVLLTGI